MTKLRIDLQTGVLEVEGEESFVRQVYDDYKSKLNSIQKSQDIKQDERQIPSEKESVSTQANGKKKTKSRSARESLTIVKDLDLSAKGGKQSLRDFYGTKSPEMGMEKNAVFVYYLEKIASLNKISVNHVYSCYKDVGTRVPNALKQSLLDTSHHKGWIDTTSLEDIKTSTPGENFVEHDLPKKHE